MQRITLQIFVTRLMLLLFFGGSPAFSQSDNCATATVLTPSAICTPIAGSTVGATQSIPAISCSGYTGSADDDVWYQFTATATSHSITVVSGTGFDAVVDLRSGACNGTTIACADASATAGTETINATGLTIGATYYVRVYSYSGVTTGTFTICVSAPPPPLTNDNCSGAIALTVNNTLSCNTSTTGNTSTATQSQAGCVGNADDDVWYSFTATGTTHIVTVTPGTLSDVVFQVFSGTCGSLTSVACVDDTGGISTETRTLNGLTVGNTYYVRVYSYGTISGSFTICVTTPSALTNDNCATAIPLTVNATSSCTSTTNGFSTGATQSQAGCYGTADDDVWFQFTATGTTHGITVIPGTMNDVVFQLFSGSCGSLSSLGCIDNTAGTNIETNTFTGLTAGNTYYVRVYSYSNGTGAGTFTICVNSIVPLTNDNCAGGISLTVNPTSTCAVSTAGSTITATQSQTGCFGTADDDVWFNFTATATTHTITVTPGTLQDAVFQVFSGACGSLTSLACVDGTISGSETITLTGLTIGTTYRVRVYSWSSGTGAGTFDICVTTPVTPANDNCAGAIALTVNSDLTCVTSTTGSSELATQSMIGCSGTADDDVWFSFVATSPTHTITATMSTMYDAVMQVFSGTCGSLTSIACIDNTIGTSNESQVLTDLTPGATYYVRIYSYFNWADDAGTFTICVTTPVPCTSGSGTGTTSLGCPSVVSGGLGLNGADPEPTDCTTGNCVDLEATYLQLGQTTNYTVEAIPYAPPYQFECLANPVSVNVDDIWSPVVTLPFNFCFFGNTYNQCLISSNGVITFDLANNTPGGESEWEFYTNIPNNTLFLNSIFGVYHDIDPSIGGEVGWELITLNTGCRALVASWSNIPMYYAPCNSILYSGMIVLYENTNIIEVYIREKNVCASWNDGNAIVGLQNANGTLAVAAPGRNALDTNWNVIHEAWRFIPTGTSITSLKWYEGPDTTGPVIGTTDTITVCPSATTVYTAEVTYTLCNGVQLKETESTTVTVNANKIWNGSVSTDWDTDANWTPVGVPTSVNCVIIPDVTNDCIISGSGYNGFAYNLTVLDGGSLTLNSNNNLTVTNFVNVETGGTFDIKNSGSLIQIDPVANSGNVNIERITQPMYRFDFTYWNSPLTLDSGYTLGQLSPDTLIDKYFMWTPTQGGSNGIWIYQPPSTVMDPTRGYIVRAPQTFSGNPSIKVPYTANFLGTPNNGDVTCAVSYGSMGPAAHEDKWNLLGNPYPSAVSAALFLDHPVNQLILDGTIYFYTHNTPWSTSFPDPFYADYVINYTDTDYAAWNKTGGVGTAASTGGPAPNGYVATGQSFFVRSLAVPGSAIWTNGMRVANNNSQFFRMAQNADQLIPGETPLQRHRIWLNMTNESGSFNQLLVGYVEGATLGWDRGLDGTRFSESDITFYSIIPGEKLVIQARPLPFQVTDIVPLGYTSTNSGTYSIKIDHFDDFFDNKKIYLEDKLLKTLHDLKSAPYNFTTQAGTFDNRFVLRYAKDPKIPTVLNITGLIKFQRIAIQSNQTIKAIHIHDVSGKHVRTYIPNEESTSFEGDFLYDRGVYFARVETSDDEGNVKLINQD